jgi:hypothetical protein
MHKLRPHRLLLSGEVAQNPVLQESPKEEP